MENDRKIGHYRCIYITLIALGSILTVLGVILLFLIQWFIHKDISQQIPLKNGTEAFDAWVDPPVPVHMQFWLFDLINKDEYVNKGFKPILREKGPYTYREIRKKSNLSFTRDETLISYREPKSYVFVPEMSNGTEDDTFTNINLPLVAVGTMLRFYPPFMQRMLPGVLALLGEHLFTEYTVKHYLWGYEEPTLKKLNDFTLKYFNKSLVKNDVFGLFSGPTANGSDDGQYTVYTGRGDLSKFNEIKMWENKSSLSFWTTPWSNMINGTDGSGWHPFIKKSETLHIFASDVCRSVYTKYTGSGRVKGIPVYKFSPPAAVLQDHIHNPDNIGYCTPDCLKAGVLNVSVCREGAPIIVSQPHFYQGDQSYIDAFEGLHPDASRHATIINVEPNTGLVLNAAKKLQLNIYVRNLLSLRETTLLNDTIFPVVWLKESAVISDEAAARFREMITLPTEVAGLLPWVLLAVGLLLVLAGISVFIFLRKRDSPKDETVMEQAPDEEQQPLINSGEEQPVYNTTVSTTVST